MKILKESPNGKYFRAEETIDNDNGEPIKYNIIGKHRQRIIKGEDGKNYNVNVPARIFYTDDEKEEVKSIL